MMFFWWCLLAFFLVFFAWVLPCCFLLGFSGGVTWAFLVVSAWVFVWSGWQASTVFFQSYCFAEEKHRFGIANYSFPKEKQGSG